jgi:tetrapyrrole methylase family protein/MazG family protein
MIKFLYIDDSWIPDGETARPIYHADPLHPSFARLGAAVLPLPAEGIEEGTIVSPGNRGPVYDLVNVVDRLLGPGGCPWDQEQTHESLKRHLLEEAYEVLEAIDGGSRDALVEELGDLLLQPIMHGQMERLAGQFDTDDVARGIVDKLVRRHPHVFGEVSVADADEVLKNWDQIKQKEKGGEVRSILAGVPKGMASLLRAFEISKRAARSGFEWPDIEAVFGKLAEEETELREALATKDEKAIASEVGDLLFTAVNISRWAGVEPEEALRQMLNRFTARFVAMEAESAKPLRELTAAEWDQLWVAAKIRVG